MLLLVNVSPDRHGIIPDLEQVRLRDMGSWMSKMGEAIYGTRGGPWEPAEEQYGYCFKGSVVYVRPLSAYAGTTFGMPPLGKLHITKAYDVYTGQSLPFNESGDVRSIDCTSSSADSIVAVVYNADIRSIWKK